MHFTDMREGDITSKTTREIRTLIEVLTQKSSDLNEEYLREVLSTPNMCIRTAVDGDTIVGVGSLCVIPFLARRKSILEDMAVLESVQGRGLGRTIAQSLIQFARQLKAANIQLTSGKNENRAKANQLYQNLGFSSWETNLYRMILNYD